MGGWLDTLYSSKWDPRGDMALQQKAGTFLFSQNVEVITMSESKFRFLASVARSMQNFERQRFAKCSRLLFKSLSI
jgi:hypothetical protein